MKQAYLVDTNVLVLSDDAKDLKCHLACHKRLQEITANGELLIDDAFRILGEYRNNVQAGQTQGFAFFKWASQNGKITRITPHYLRGFEEFPSDSDLEGFDPSDRKFVAVALASDREPAIVNAIDTDWADFHDALARYITIEFLCPHLCAPSGART